jgi:hypothetical protein
LKPRAGRLVTIKRGLSPAAITSALPITCRARRRRRQGRAAVVPKHPVLAERIGFVAGDVQERIATQLVVIVEVFVAQGQPFEPLRQEFFQPVLDKAWVALIVEALGQRPRHAQAVIDLAQQQRPTVAGERAAGEIGHDFSMTQGLKEQRLIVTEGVTSFDE